MEIKKKIVVPTGEIYTAIGEKGMLEFLTVGDYGKNANIKADFLGITRDLNGVPNGEPMPLTEKWVITISTQYGCSMGCKFCDVPKVGIGRNATFNDLKGEVLTAIEQHPEVKHTKRLNIHYARMGEPTWNANVLLHAISIKKDIEPFIGDSLVHPVISTMLPKRNKKLVEFLHKWCYIKKLEETAKADFTDVDDYGVYKVGSFLYKNAFVTISKEDGLWTLHVISEAPIGLPLIKEVRYKYLPNNLMMAQIFGDRAEANEIKGVILYQIPNGEMEAE